jgi:hypothetical protein
MLLTATMISLYVTWVLLLAVAYAVFALYRHFGQMYLTGPVGRAQQGPEIGSALLSIARSDTYQRPVVLPAERPTVVLFADTSCDLCSVIRDKLAELDEFAPRVGVTVFCGGTKRDVAAWAGRTPDHVQVVCDEKSAAADHYRVNTLPFAIAVDATGTVKAKSIINGTKGLVWAAEQALDLGLTATQDEISEAVRT